MREELGSYIKLAADVVRGVVAGGGEMHYDCEQVLLDNGSQQENIWGANWYPDEQRLEFEALINIRPHQNNRTMMIQDPELRTQIDKLVRSIFEGKSG
ncbi:MAG: hypothetical protein HY782_04795 [Chloroflexi bacterium]|nr:hypothetical protein [Chloroflexota bacterium]